MASGATIHTANGLKVRVQRRKSVSQVSEQGTKSGKGIAVAA